MGSRPETVAVLCLATWLTIWGTTRGQQEQYHQKRQQLKALEIRVSDPVGGRTPGSRETSQQIKKTWRASLRRPGGMPSCSMRTAVEKAQVRMLEAELRLLRLETQGSSRLARIDPAQPGTATGFLDQKRVPPRFV